MLTRVTSLAILATTVTHSTMAEEKAFELTSPPISNFWDAREWDSNDATEFWHASYEKRNAPGIAKAAKPQCKKPIEASAAEPIAKKAQFSNRQTEE